MQKTKLTGFLDVSIYDTSSQKKNERKQLQVTAILENPYDEVTIRCIDSDKRISALHDLSAMYFLKLFGIKADSCLTHLDKSSKIQSKFITLPDGQKRHSPQHFQRVTLILTSANPDRRIL